MTRFLLICLGGALGTGARYLTSLWAANALGLKFPYGTLIVNLAGSFLLGFIMQFAAPSDFRLVLTVGVMGGFTTYSSFNYETTSFFREGAWVAGAAYATATFAGCLIAGLAGMALARGFGR